MINEIYESYMKYRAEVLSNYYPMDYMKVVIIMPPQKWMELEIELVKEQKEYITWGRGENCRYIDLAGDKTPVIIDDKLPQGTEFQIISQRDYERLEQEKLIKKMREMFE